MLVTKKIQNAEFRGKLVEGEVPRLPPRSPWDKTLWERSFHLGEARPNVVFVFHRPASIIALQSKARAQKGVPVSRGLNCSCCFADLDCFILILASPVYAFRRSREIPSMALGPDQQQELHLGVYHFDQLANPLSGLTPCWHVFGLRKKNAPSIAHPSQPSFPAILSAGMIEQAPLPTQMTEGELNSLLARKARCRHTTTDPHTQRCQGSCHIVRPDQHSAIHPHNNEPPHRCTRT